MRCTFIGHRQVFEAGIETRVFEAITNLMVEDEDFEFYTGRSGEFVRICHHAVCKAKLAHNEKNIRTILVEPYMKQSLNSERIVLKTLFDEILVPEELIGIHYKRAITKRNQWMIDRCQYLIAYVQRDFGGAWAALNYAKERGVTVYNLANK